MPSASTPDPGAFAGIVLAGGASRRMGCDKARLAFGDGTLLDHSVRRLREAGADPVFVSGDRPAYASVPDRRPGQGPLGGIASVVSARPDLRDRVMVVVPVDTPYVSASALRRLASACRQGLGAVYGDSPLPMAIRVTERVEATLHGLLEPGGSGAVGALARELGLRVLSADDVDLTNLNTPQDCARSSVEVS